MKRLPLVFLIFLLSCCAQPASIEKPEIRDVSHRWGEVTHSTTEIITDVKVFNPNPVPLQLKDILTEVYMNNLKIGQGSVLKADIKAKSESDILISTKLENGKIPEWWVSHIKNGERTRVNIVLELVVEALGNEFKFKLAETESEFKTSLMK